MRPAALSGLQSDASSGCRPTATTPAMREAVAMVRYRRNRVPGGTYFFTLTLRDRRIDMLVRRMDMLKASWRAVQTAHPHRVVAAVVLPEHLHAVIAMADGSADYSGLWRELKKGFTRRAAPSG